MDINSREIIEAFLFDIQADKPQVDKVIAVQVMRGKEKLIKHSFISPIASSTSMFSLVSSCEDVL